ncbi:hypothetical protein HPB47_022205 [Ixodes persulcatus]|uniref:Uncharacterized protein n=1 Tax=Ixodes persulcatus TaxID=34615 RepID=A0AC60QAQ7_IXOPE|nr:hypothetical protein HPB47_022205 [Ixodes persulcatus]
MEKLKKKRGVVRSAISRLINEMTTAMNQPPAQQGRGTKRDCCRVELVLRSHHGPAKIVVEALEVPEICGEILTLTDGDIIRNLQRRGITLADLPVGDCQGERGVSILIGADYYWKVTAGNGPVKVSNAPNVCLTTTVFNIHDDDEPPRFGHGDTLTRPIRDDRKPYEDEKPTVMFDDRCGTPARPIKCDRDSYDFSPAGRSLSVSSPVDFYRRPVQVLTGEKAHQQEELLRRKEQYERVQSRMMENKRLQVARRPPEEQTIHRQPQMPQRGDIPLRERGDREEVLAGEKEAQVEEMLRKQYEQYRQQLNGRRDRNKKEAVGRPLELERRPVQPPSGRVTSPPVDHFERSVQKLSGEKSSKQTELLRRMYERAESNNDDDKDDYDGSYDQTCLHDRKQGTSFLSSPKVKHTYVYKYERKVLTRPLISKNVGNIGKQ